MRYSAYRSNTDGRQRFPAEYGSGENIQEELFPKGDKITIDMDSDYFVGERISKFLRY